MGGTNKIIGGTNKKRTNNENITVNQQYMCYFFPLKGRRLELVYFSFCLVDRGFSGPRLGLPLLVGGRGDWTRVTEVPE